MKTNNLKNCKYGDFIFFTPISLNGHLIKLIDKSPYSHVSIYYGIIDGHHFMIESNSVAGVQLKRIKENYRNFDIVPLAKRYKGFLKNKETLLNVEGSKYDMNKIAKFLVDKIFKTKLAKEKNRQFVCSEFVNFAYGYHLVEYGKDTVSAIYNAVKNNG